MTKFFIMMKEQKYMKILKIYLEESGDLHEMGKTGFG